MRPQNWTESIYDICNLQHAELVQCVLGAHKTACFVNCAVQQQVCVLDAFTMLLSGLNGHWVVLVL